MPDTLSPLLSQINIGDLPVILSATAAIGTASYGLLDSTKAIKGGISNWGFGFIREALDPVKPILTDLGTDILALARANWLNGVAKENQKMAIRNIIRLGLSQENAGKLDPTTLTVAPADLANAAGKARRGEQLSDVELAVLARFDATIDLRLDAAFERADQRFRNSSRFCAAIIAILLSQAGAFAVYHGQPWDKATLGFVVGLVAVPLAPIAKDLSSAITTAVAAFKAIRK